MVKSMADESLAEVDTGERSDLMGLNSKSNPRVGPIRETNQRIDGGESKDLEHGHLSRPAATNATKLHVA